MDPGAEDHRLTGPVHKDGSHLQASRSPRPRCIFASLWLILIPQKRSDFPRTANWGGSDTGVSSNFLLGFLDFSLPLNDFREAVEQHSN